MKDLKMTAQLAELDKLRFLVKPTFSPGHWSSQDTPRWKQVFPSFDWNELSLFSSTLQNLNFEFVYFSALTFQRL